MSAVAAALIRKKRWLRLLRNENSRGRHRWLRERDDRQAETSGKDEAKSQKEEKLFHDRSPLLTPLERW